MEDFDSDKSYEEYSFLEYLLFETNVCIIRMSSLFFEGIIKIKGQVRVILHRKNSESMHWLKCSTLLCCIDYPPLYGFLFHYLV